MTFTEFAQSLGLLVNHCQADSVWHRVKTQSHPHKKNGAFKLFADGRIGYVQDHAAHPEPLRWDAGADVALPKIDRAAIARQRSVDRRTTMRAILAARDYWRTCTPLRGHPYLESHGLDMTGCSGLATNLDGWLWVPAWKGKNLMSLQKISPTGEKRYWPNAPIGGAYHLLDRKTATITVLCEGLATGLAVFAACPSARVYVCFDAGNMAKVQIPMRGLATVAADNDLATFDRLGRNPGIDAAKALSERIGAGVAWPEGIVGTDWCDFRQEKRAEALARRGRFQSEGQVFKAVDEMIAREITRSAKFVTAR